MKGGAGLFKYWRDEPHHWLPACPLPERAGSPVGWSVVPEREAHQKAHVGCCGSAALRGGRLRIPAPTPRSLLRILAYFPLILSVSGVCRAAGRALYGKEDPFAWGIEQCAEILRGSDSAGGRRGEEFVSEKGVKPHAEDWHLRTPGRHSLGPTAGSTSQRL